MVVALQKAGLRPRRVTILGSTGSVGCNAIDLIERAPERLEAEALTAYRNVELLAAQALKLRPRLAVIGDMALYGVLRERLSGSGIEAAAGPAALIEAASRPADCVVAAIVGAAGLEPTLAAVRRGAVVALANKECLVCAGDLFMREVTRCGATLLPVDSEHNAIFQVLNFAEPETVERLILTASGGPFLTRDLASLAQATPAEAVRHPNWDMGAKISVDSATMMNKGLELIEAYHLFPVEARQIEILIHPQSVVHSLVGYIDGSVLAQLGSPDMRTPISYALSWPTRLKTPAARLDLAALGRLTFEAPDPGRFPALALARQALQSGGAAPTILNAANEAAVAGFLAGRIGFLDIVGAVETALSSVPDLEPETLPAVQEIDRAARRAAESWMAERR